MTAIQNFYKNQVIFITGGTGFLGKVLLEKLLRVTEVQSIYLLIREKQNKSPEQRLQDLLQDEFFKTIQDEANSRDQLLFSKVTAMSGDCSLPGLGLSEEHRNVLLNNVNIVFHCAATVRFMEPLRKAIRINVVSTLELLEFGKQMPYLKSFIHVSTAFVHCNKSQGDESIICEMPCGLSGSNACKLIDVMDDKLLDKITPQLVNSYPNTYTYTKSLAENIVATQAQDIPISVFRPASVVSTYKDPIPGWVDNLYGVLGIVRNVMTGHLHILRYRRPQEAQIVPVDYCVNGLIASGYYTAQKLRFSDTSPTVFNYAPELTNPTTWTAYIDLAVELGRENPVKCLFWYPFLISTESSFIRALLRTLLHKVPAYCIDLWASYSGNKLRSNFSLSTFYKRLHKITEQIDHFTMNDYRVTNCNVRRLWTSLSEQDKQLFPFDMLQVNWKKHHYDSVMGLRRYMLKEGPETFEAGRRRYKKLLCLHYLMSLIVFGLPILALYCLIF